MVVKLGAPTESLSPSTMEEELGAYSIDALAHTPLVKNFVVGATKSVTYSPLRTVLAAGIKYLNVSM